MAGDYGVNDYVRYGQNGICKIFDITMMETPGSRKKSEYYVLKPVCSEATTLYVPAGNDSLTSKMCKVPSKSELDGIILSTEDQGILWPEDRKERNEYFRDILKKSDQKELLMLISCVYRKRLELVNVGKKLCATDESVLKQAEKLIQNDFSFALEIPAEEVSGYIRRLLGMGE